MQLHELKAKTQNKENKRIGRGGKRGTYSGRGVKGQKSRSGRRIRPSLRDLLIRIPKMRGLRHKSIVNKPVVFNLDDLTRLALNEVSAEALSAKKLLPRSFRGRIKVLGAGELSKPIIIAKGVLLSKEAKAKIEKAGGTIQ
jgi:large subunit ribosomal protein L15